jgi:hypothetical protein
MLKAKSGSGLLFIWKFLCSVISDEPQIPGVLKCRLPEFLITGQTYKHILKGKLDCLHREGKSVNRLFLI